MIRGDGNLDFIIEKEEAPMVSSAAIQKKTIKQRPVNLFLCIVYEE